MIEKGHPGTYVTVVCGSYKLLEDRHKTTMAKLESKGILFCEYKHPDIKDLTPATLRQRIYELDHERIGAIIVGIDPVHEHKKFIGLQLTFKPAGPYGPTVKSMLNNGENFRLGLRGIKDANGELKDIITFDIISPE